MTTEDSKDPKELDDKEELQNVMLIPDLSHEPAIRILNVYGEINEERARGTLTALNLLKLTGRIETENEENEETEPEVSYEPIEFLISTEGGNVQDMFSIYDGMRQIQKECEIHTVGLGKIMSAGILLLAAGTKGKRKVGRHCRLMIHSIQGGQFGSIKELEVDIREVRWYQEQFIKAIAAETKLDRKELKSIFRRKTDTYFDAEQALKWGIADEII